MTDHDPPPVDPASALAPAVAAWFGALPGVRAVAMGGSRTGGGADERSDLDLYVYATAEIPVAARAVIAGKDARERVLDHRFWEPGDTWTNAESGVEVDVMYRTPGWIEEELDRVLVRHEAAVGYSTAIWHNVLTSAPMHDPDGWFAGLQASANRPYPEALRRAIVAKNQPLLRDLPFSFLHQIELAVGRGDAVSVQHRLTALLASYLDVLFAVNRVPHPGEKRQVQHALARCEVLPAGMERRLGAVLGVAGGDGAIVGACHALIDGLDEMLAVESLR